VQEQLRAVEAIGRQTQLQIVCCRSQRPRTGDLLQLSALGGQSTEHVLSRARRTELEHLSRIDPLLRAL
jgi:hypothetical protein